MKKRELKPNYEAACALAFIRGYALDVQEIKRRYTVPQIDLMCFELGLPLIEGEVETQKARRLHTAIRKSEFPVAPALPLDVEKELEVLAEAEEAAAEAEAEAEKAQEAAAAEEKQKAEEAEKLRQKEVEESRKKAEADKKRREANKSSTKADDA